MDASLGLNKSELVKFDQELAHLHPEEEDTVREYVTSWERKGIAEGLLMGIEPMLELRFGSEGLAFVERLRQRSKLAELKRVAKQMATVGSLEELQRAAFLK